MSLDLYQDETQQALDRLPSTPTGAIEAPFFQSFLPGGLKVMAGEMAKVGRAVSMAAGVVPVAADALANALPWLPGADMRESPTELQDRFFRQHDEVFGSAVKYWTPQPGEVGMAGEIVGSLAGMLPTIIANPALAVGSQVMSQAEDLVDKGVSTTKAVGVGVAQGAGLATGIWMPILGQNLWQRVVIGGAGFNAVQGVTTRAVSQAILGDDKAAELYPTLGLKELTLDLLLGMAFGGVAHLSPEMRAQGKDAWARIATWAQDLTPAQVDAIAALRQAEHLNVETAPGTLKTPEDVEANVNRAKAALEQVLRDEPVQVEQMPAPRVEPDTARQVDAETRVAEMMADAERVRTEEGIPELLAAEPERPDMPALWGEIARLAPEEQPGAIGAAIERRLAELGVQANEAAANGAIWRSFFDTASKKYGVQAAELMRDYGIDIQRMQARSPGADAALAGAAEGGYGGGRGRLDQSPGNRPQPQELLATVAGGSPEPGWIGATSIRRGRGGEPLPVYRGSELALAPEHFEPGALGVASGNPSSGLGVWFTTTRSEAGTFGKVQEAYLDLRNPKLVKVEDLPGFESTEAAHAYREQLRAQGYDGMVVTAQHLGGKTHVVAFDAKQVIPIGGHGEYAMGGQTYFQRAPDTNSPAFKRWSNDAPLVTSAEADTHQFKTGEKIVVEAFHGTKRPDRVGEKFLKKRATSGPMAFHTSSPELASRYAESKQDTSLAYEETGYENWFKYKPKGARSTVDIARAWYSLTPEQKLVIAERAPTLRESEDGKVVSLEGNTSGNGSYDHNLKETQRGFDRQGNPLKALVEDWLNSGVLFDREELFLDVLKQAGFPVKEVSFDSPHASHPFVYKNYIAMQKPLVTSDIPQDVRDALVRAAKYDRSRPAAGGGDMWDKNTRTLREWVAEFEKQDAPYVWTSIPDKVTVVLKSLGYDGIVDWSGKGGGDVHPVYIPFDETQVKSAIGNKGTFGDTNNILKQSSARGQINFDDGSTIISLFEGANASTFAHETGHLFLQITRDLAARTDAPSAAVADWATLEGWLGIKDGDIPVAAHEQFARGWEKYLAEGVAPTPELKGIFQQFRDWLLQVYRTLTELDVNLNDEIRGVMDRMLASEAADPTPARARATTEAEGAPAPTGRAVPPPPRGEAGEARATPEAQDEPDPWLQVGRENAPAAEPAPARGLEDQEVRDILLVMAEHEAGWAEIGGRHLGGELGQPNFSAWVPRADWWPKREGKLNEAQTKEAVRKALAGEKLKKKEQLAIDYMVKIAGARANDVQAVGKDEWELTAAEVADAGLEPSTRNVVDAALLARANEISEGAVERLAVMFENDDAGFMAAVRRLIDENHQQGRRIRADLEAARRGQETGGQAPGPAGAEPQGPAVAGAGEPAAGSGAGQRPAAEPQGPAGADAAVDPLRQAVDDIVAADPNRMIVVGRNPDGTPIARTVGEYLEEARMQTELARQDAGLFEIAARCMLGGQ